MARPDFEYELDPAIIPILDSSTEMTMDEWLRSLRDSESVPLGVSGAELVAESRIESE